MFLNGKYLEMIQSHNTTNHTWTMIQIRPDSNAPSNLDQWPDSDLPPKLHVLVHLFEDYPRRRTISTSYMSQYIYLLLTKYAELLLKATCYKLNKYIYVQLTLWHYTSQYVLCILSKVGSSLGKTCLDWASKRCIRNQRVKERRSIVSYLTLFPSVSLFTSFPVYLTANQWPKVSHHSKGCFSGHLDSLIPLYNDGSTSTLLLWEGAFLFQGSFFWLTRSKEVSIYIGVPLIYPN